MKNFEFARILKEIAFFLEMDEIQFKPRAYERAAISIEVLEEEVNEIYKKAKENPIYKGVLDATEEPLVSSDIIGSSFSSIIDLTMTRVIDGDLVKILSWYDNEWGYSHRLVDMAQLLGSPII